MASHRPLPRQWNRDELAEHRRQAVDVFVSWYRNKGNTAYRGHYARAVTAVESVFEDTADLLDFGPDLLAKREKPKRDAARYLAGPPLSDDDLKILARASKLWEPSRITDFADVIAGAFDPERFPWLFSRPRRRPTAQERNLAVRWTAGLLAAQKASTERRNESSKRQEQAVDVVLASCPQPFSKVKPRAIVSVRDLDLGEYCRQSKVGGTRADLSIALRDKRLLLLECKVSNSEVNSYKRLIHEVGNKASTWRGKFGDSALPGAVLAGAFSLDNLEQAQTAGIYLFWEADLSSLVSFVEAAR